jgi:hypothetical protein
VVDFSNGEDVGRWIGSIRPPERRREATQALAVRVALRYLPLLGFAFDERARELNHAASDLVLPVFRAMALSWVNCKWQARSKKLAPQAADSIAQLGTAMGIGKGPVEALYPIIAANNTINLSLVKGGRNAARLAAGTLHISSADPTDSDAVFACVADAEAIASKGSGTDVLGSPLWRNGQPEAAAENWQRLKKGLLSTDRGWDVWTDWYEARLAGDAACPPNEALELARATIPDETWRQGPATVNAEIKRLIAEHQSLQQRPAAFQFRVVDDKIDALPDDALPIDAETARDFYDEAKRKGQDLKDRLQRTQADENIRAHVDLLLARLGSSYADMRSGLMLSALRSLESDVRAYDGEEGRKELSAAHLSNIVDLAQSVRDLCAIFPRSREIEAEAVSLGLPMQRIPEIREAIGSVVAKVNASDGATEGGRAAINAAAADLAHLRGLAEEAKQSAYFLVDFANFTRAGVRHLKATGRTVGGEIAGLGADSWRAVRRGAPKGIERGATQAGKALVVGGVAALMHWLGSDIAALGTMVAPYLPLHEMLEKMTGAAPIAPASSSAASLTSPDVADDAPAPRATRARKPKARRPRKT